MNTIILEDLTFFAHHGVSAEERKVGNRYSVTVYVKTNFSGAKREDSIIHTVDYGELYRIVKAQMKIPTQLLEHLGYRIMRKMFVQFPEIHGVEIRVSKFNPPIGGTCQKATIVIKEKRRNIHLTEVESFI